MEMPKILPRCKVCNNIKQRFLIQRDIDEGLDPKNIAKKYNIPGRSVALHINGNHRDNLIAFGTIDYVVRKKAIDVGLTLADLINKWSSGLPIRTPDTIKDSDAIKAMELYMKASGTLINKHEVTVKRTIEDALKDFLGETEDEKEHTETEEGKDDTIEECKTDTP